MSTERKPSNIIVKKLDMTDFLEEAKKDISEMEQCVKVDIQYPLGFVDTKGGMMVICEEGVGWVIQDNENFPVELFVKQKENEIPLFPKYEVKISPEKLREFPTTYVPLEKFIRVFGSRLESNYYEICREINRLNREGGIV
jgi:hypothetical protein